MKKSNGFTLIELMIVIAIIGILIGTTFKLMRVAAESKARAVTIARMERLQNALSGYFSAYGMYPAVPTTYVNTDPNAADFVDESSGKQITDKNQRIQAAARAQPVAFEFPTPLWLTTDRLKELLGLDVISMADAWASMEDVDEWTKSKTFKFGLISFLLPRVEVVGNSYNDQGSRNNDLKAPIADVYIMEQWKGNNKSSSVDGRTNDADKERAQRLRKQHEIENEVCRRWMPCFEGTLNSFSEKILGVQVHGGGGNCLVKRFLKGSTKVALAYITIVDGWGNEFYYYSAPPHQSFRVWSAGPDGQTFPPWIPSTEYPDAVNWIKDDIIGGKLQ